MNKNIALRNMERRIVQRACPTLLDEALDLSLFDVDVDVVEIERLVGVSKTLLTEPVGATCDVPVR
jgi:hypothetical protein